MSDSNSRSASQNSRKNENPKSRPRKLISQAKNRSANVQCAVEKSLRRKLLTFASTHRPIVSPASSSSAKQSSVATFPKSRPKNFSQREKLVSSKASSQNAAAPSPLI